MPLGMRFCRHRCSRTADLDMMRREEKMEKREVTAAM
jgi:hypothetical protein